MSKAMEQAKDSYVMEGLMCRALTGPAMGIRSTMGMGSTMRMGSTMSMGSTMGKGSTMWVCMWSNIGTGMRLIV